jgi:hypothetical protein
MQPGEQDTIIDATDLRKEAEMSSFSGSTRPPYCQWPRLRPTVDSSSGSALNKGSQTAT